MRLLNSDNFKIIITNKFALIPYQSSPKLIRQDHVFFLSPPSKLLRFRDKSKLHP